MDEVDEAIVDVGFGPDGDSANGARQHPVRHLAEHDEDNRNGRGLKIHVRSDQLGQLLHLVDQVAQAWWSFLFVVARDAERAYLRRLIIGGRCGRAGLHAWTSRQATRLCGQYLHELVGNVGSDVR